MIKMVTPQQRGQVIVKSIGEIERETTVKARPMGSRTMGAVGAGIKAGQNIAGVLDTARNLGSNLSKAGGMYNRIAFSKGNFLVMGLALGNEAARAYVIPNRSDSFMSNLITMKYVASAHILYSCAGALTKAAMGKK